MTKRALSALVTPQWWAEWERVDWAANGHATAVHGYLTLVMKASDLRKLSGVYRRSPDTEEARSSDTRVQRPHEEARSREIRRFVEQGYPRSNMTRAQLRKSSDADRRPGWLPTAVVVNILEEGETREGRLPLPPEFAIHVAPHDWNGGSVSEVLVPTQSAEGSNSQIVPANVTAPIEIIDGQHRLWAFEDDEDTADYYLTVVAFHGLSPAFQAYLFWSVNIKPKKINTSLAFDLYPILRSQEWLMRSEGLKVYRESRAQELTEALWSAPASPWYERINMIGATGVSDDMPVTQASFVRALLASFVRPWAPQGGRSLSGGLFSSDDAGGLDWNRNQQAGFLAAAWGYVVEACEQAKPGWWVSLKEAYPDAEVLSRYTLLGTDQGVRTFSLVLNEISYKLRDEFSLREWRTIPSGDTIDPREVSRAMHDIENTSIAALLRSLAEGVSKYDWRSTRFIPNDSEREQLEVFRGSGGYARLRLRLYESLATSSDDRLNGAARDLYGQIKEEAQDQ